MRYTTKRNGKNVIPLLMAVCGINMPYWRIDRADDLHSYLSGDAADRLAVYEDEEEQGLLVRLPCKVGDTVWFVIKERTVILNPGIYSGVVREIKAVQRQTQTLYLAVVEYEYPDPWYDDGRFSKSEMHCSFTDFGSWPRFYVGSRVEAEAALKGGQDDV